MDRVQRSTATFIVRIWTEYLNQNPPICRGEIESVASGEKRTFADLSALIRLLQLQTDAKSRSSEVK